MEYRLVVEEVKARIEWRYAETDRHSATPWKEQLRTKAHAAEMARMIT